MNYQKKFCATNFGMAFGNENINPNDTLFMKQSTCIYNYNMFNTINNNINEIKTQEKNKIKSKRKSHKHKNNNNLFDLNSIITFINFWFDL